MDARGDPRRGGARARAGGRRGRPKGAVQRAVVGRLLRGPGWRLLPRSLVLIEYRGRRTGAAHALPTRAAADGGRLVVAVGHAEHKTWWRNLQDGPLAARVHVRGRERQVTARLLLLGQADHAAARGAYGRRFPRTRLSPETPFVELL